MYTLKIAYVYDQNLSKCAPPPPHTHPHTFKNSVMHVFDLGTLSACYVKFNGYKHYTYYIKLQSHFLFEKYFESLYFFLQMVEQEEVGEAFYMHLFVLKSWWIGLDKRE